MKRIWVSIIAAGLLTIAAFSPVAGEDTITLDLQETDDSGVSGNVRIASANGETDVEVLITAGLQDGAVHPVHIHDGTCDDLGGVAYPLDDIVGGVSESTVDAELSELLEGEYAINVHLSADEMQVNIACADVVEPAVGGPADDDEEAADDEATDDEAADDHDHADDAMEDDEADDVEDEIVPAAGSVGGVNSDSMALIIALIAASTLGVGVLVRRQAFRTSAS
jgi:hypothetical protein